LLISPHSLPSKETAAGQNQTALAVQAGSSR
jgi:hypothetical protein